VYSFRSVINGVSCNESLSLDQARILLNVDPSVSSTKLNVKVVNSQCPNCLEQVLINSADGLCGYAYTPFSWTLYLYVEDTFQSKLDSVIFGAAATYYIDVDSKLEMHISELEAPENVLYPLIILIIFLFLISLIILTYQPMKNLIISHRKPEHIKNDNNDATSPLIQRSPQSSNSLNKKQRLFSLDTFRYLKERNHPYYFNFLKQLYKY
jgi:hypothetical protein